MNIKEKAKTIKNGDQGKAQFVRFVLNGIFAAALQYVVYLALMPYMVVDVAYGVSYFVSFLVNFFTTTYFTFRSHATWKKFVGFCGSHWGELCVQPGIVLALHQCDTHECLHCPICGNGRGDAVAVYYPEVRV